MVNHLPKFLTTDELAAMLDCSVRHIIAMREKGTGPAYITIGRSIRYSPASIQSWLDSVKQTGPRTKSTPTRRKAPTK